jgi:hypothetical protein
VCSPAVSAQRAQTALVEAKVPVHRHLLLPLAILLQKTTDVLTCMHDGTIIKDTNWQRVRVKSDGVLEDGDVQQLPLDLLEATGTIRVYRVAAWICGATGDEDSDIQPRSTLAQLACTLHARVLRGGRLEVGQTPTEVAYACVLALDACPGDMAGQWEAALHPFTSHYVARNALENVPNFLGAQDIRDMTWALLGSPDVQSRGLAALWVAALVLLCGEPCGLTTVAPSATRGSPTVSQHAPLAWVDPNKPPSRATPRSLSSLCLCGEACCVQGCTWAPDYPLGAGPTWPWLAALNVMSVTPEQTRAELPPAAIKIRDALADDTSLAQRAGMPGSLYRVLQGVPLHLASLPQLSQALDTGPDDCAEAARRCVIVWACVAQFVAGAHAVSSPGDDTAPAEATVSRPATTAGDRDANRECVWMACLYTVVRAWNLVAFAASDGRPWNDRLRIVVPSTTGKYPAGFVAVQPPVCSASAGGEATNSPARLAAAVACLTLLGRRPPDLETALLDPGLTLGDWTDLLWGAASCQMRSRPYKEDAQWIRRALLSTPHTPAALGWTFAKMGRAALATGVPQALSPSGGMLKAFLDMLTLNGTCVLTARALGTFVQPVQACLVDRMNYTQNMPTKADAVSYVTTQAQCLYVAMVILELFTTVVASKHVVSGVDVVNFAAFLSPASHRLPSTAGASRLLASVLELPLLRAVATSRARQSFPNPCLQPVSSALGLPVGHRYPHAPATMSSKL